MLHWHQQPHSQSHQEDGGEGGWGGGGRRHQRLRVEAEGVRRGGGGAGCWPGLFTNPIAICILFTNLFTNSILKEKRERALKRKETKLEIVLQKERALFFFL